MCAPCGMDKGARGKRIQRFPAPALSGSGSKGLSHPWADGPQDPYVGQKTLLQGPHPCKVASRAWRRRQYGEADAVSAVLSLITYFAPETNNHRDTEPP